MMRAKIIKTEADYNATLARIEELMDADSSRTEDVDELELLAVLVERYEEERYPIDLPSPVDAIQFRMDQQGLRQVDLVECLGSASKVSEVLSGRRSLSLQMIRRLHNGLDIPAEILLQSPETKLPAKSGIDWKLFPLAEMRKRGWFKDFNGTLQELKQYAEELILDFAKDVGHELLKPVYCRSSNTGSKEMDAYALAVWQVKVRKNILKESLPRYISGTITKKFAKSLVGLSFFSDGPTLAREYLNKHGIHLVTEKHLSKTYLDGAVMLSSQGNPIVALTLRYDRLDNFWFTLCHELAHVALHLDTKTGEDIFFDDLDYQSEEQTERDANQWASEVMLDPQKWSRTGFNTTSKPSVIVEWSNREKISPAIPAGRIRKESGNYRVFSKLLGSKAVRSHFPESGWR